MIVTSSSKSRLMWFAGHVLLDFTVCQGLESTYYLPKMVVILAANALVSSQLAGFIQK